MINKIFNWTLGSFFRTLGRILVYILVAFIAMLFISGKVHAESVPLYLPNDNRQIIVPAYARFYSLNGLSYTANSTGAYSDYGYYVTEDTVTSNGSGEVICFDTSTALVENVTYTITIYLGSLNNSYYYVPNINYKTPSIGTTLSSAITYWSNRDYGLNLNYNVYSSSRFGFVDADGNDLLIYANYLVYVITPTRNGKAVCIPFNASVTTTYPTIFYGFTYDVLGNLDNLTTSDIQNVISSSGLATASSVDEVNESVAELKTELNDVNSSIEEQTQQQQQNHEETMNYLTDDTAPESDISSLGNVQGLLPPGPLDSLLNIPFKFLSIITSSMSGTCVPLSGTFVFDSTLTLPCFSELIYDDVPEYLMFFINLIPACFILIKYLKHLYKKVDRAVSMNTTADDEWGVL